MTSDTSAPNTSPYNYPEVRPGQPDSLPVSNSEQHGCRTTLFPQKIMCCTSAQKKNSTDEQTTLCKQQKKTYGGFFYDRTDWNRGKVKQEVEDNHHCPDCPSDSFPAVWRNPAWHVDNRR